MIAEKLDNYRNYLHEGTYQSLGYEDISKSRYQSFKKCLDYLQTIDNPNILELGTCRSFVDGKFEGCNLDDTIYWHPQDPSFWDWGAGCFLLVIGEIIENGNITTVDLIASHIKRSKVMTDSLGIKCNHVVSDSLAFLRNTPEKYDLIYVDTGDMWPIEPTAQLQLDECKIIVERNLLKPGGLILIDDVLNKTPKELGDTNNELGKSKYSLNYLLEQDYEIIYKGYQYLLKKN